MSSFSRDPIINVVNNGIKGDIRVLLEQERYRGVLLLTLAGIDAMAFLGMQGTKEKSSRSDFIRWVETYIQFPCEEQLSGLELYAARCAALHSYSTESALSITEQCREIGWMGEAVPEIVYNPRVSESLVMVSVPALVAAFFEGIDRFLIHLYADSDRAAIADERFGRILHMLPIEQGAV